jgi:hypothetical protein
MKSDIINKRVKLIRMEDPYTKLKKGDEGFITKIDDIGNIHVKWDSGLSISLIPEVDEYEILEKKKLKIKKFFEFKSESFIDSKLDELKDLVSDFSNNFVFSWEENDDVISINLDFDNSTHLYIIDTHDNILSKYFKEEIDLDIESNKYIEFKKDFSNLDDALDIIEKDIMSILEIHENLKLIKKNKNLK